MVGALIQITVLIFSVILHEVAHGFVAFRLGDPTAKYQGRLNLNPLNHLDPLGSIIVPALTYMMTYMMPGMMGGVIFGWAKPVPINPYNFRDRRKGELLVSLAGPATNIAVGVTSALLLRVVPATTVAFYVLKYMSLINLILAFFNLFPVPPLDGSHILANLWPGRTERIKAFFQRYGMFLFLIFIFFGVNWVYPLVKGLFFLVSGLSS